MRPSLLLTTLSLTLASTVSGLSNSPTSQDPSQNSLSATRPSRMLSILDMYPQACSICEYWHTIKVADSSTDDERGEAAIKLVFGKCTTDRCPPELGGEPEARDETKHERTKDEL